jgi:hypothetical protein
MGVESVDRDEFINELLAGIKRTLEKAYDRGHAEGSAGVEDMRRRMLDALGISPAMAEPAPQRRRTTHGSAPKARAQKGAVGAAIELVFKDGMTTRELQDAAREVDESINPKTVYNELQRRKAMYRQDGGRWFRANQNATPPTVPSSLFGLNGTVGGHGTGLSSGVGLTARGPGAPGEAGGT